MKNVWIVADSKIIELKGAKPVESDYFGKIPGSSSDFYLEFLNFLFQRAITVKTFPKILSIQNDIHNLSASLSKIDLFFYSRREYHVHRFVTTEIEYIFNVCRSIYDLLQEIISDIWDTSKLFDDSVRKSSLKKSFAKMVFHNNEIITQEQLMDKYGLSPKIAQFYVKEAPFFKILREYRNMIEHGGHTPERIFETEKGFAIFSDNYPFKEFEVWDEDTFLKNKLAPLRPVISYIVYRTFNSMNNFIFAVSQEFIFPDEIAPDYKLFIRGNYTIQLVNLPKYIKSEVWYSK